MTDNRKAQKASRDNEPGNKAIDVLLLFSSAAQKTIAISSIHQRQSRYIYRYDKPRRHVRNLTPCSIPATPTCKNPNGPSFRFCSLGHLLAHTQSFNTATAQSPKRKPAVIQAPYNSPHLVRFHRGRMTSSKVHHGGPDALGCDCISCWFCCCCCCCWGWACCPWGCCCCIAVPRCCCCCCWCCVTIPGGTALDICGVICGVFMPCCSICWPGAGLPWFDPRPPASWPFCCCCCCCWICCWICSCFWCICSRYCCCFSIIICWWLNCCPGCCCCCPGCCCEFCCWPSCCWPGCCCCCCWPPCCDIGSGVPPGIGPDPGWPDDPVEVFVADLHIGSFLGSKAG